jgi:hypothetical protein
MVRGCHGRLKKVENKKLQGTAKDRKTWRDLAEKAKPHKGLQWQMMMMMMMKHAIGTVKVGGGRPKRFHFTHTKYHTQGDRDEFQFR